VVAVVERIQEQVALAVQGVVAQVKLIASVQQEMVQLIQAAAAAEHLTVLQQVRAVQA
jgi:hypothetical protein